MSERDKPTGWKRTKLTLLKAGRSGLIVHAAHLAPVGDRRGRRQAKHQKACTAHFISTQLMEQGGGGGWGGHISHIQIHFTTTEDAVNMAGTRRTAAAKAMRGYTTGPKPPVVQFPSMRAGSLQGNYSNILTNTYSTQVNMYWWFSVQRHMAEVQMDIPTYESRHINLTEEKLHHHKQMGARCRAVCLSLCSLCGKGSAVLLSGGRKYGSCQGPYDAASAVYTVGTGGEIDGEDTETPGGQQIFTHVVGGRRKRHKPFFLTPRVCVSSSNLQFLSGNVCCVR